jgi:hypothetical protein
MGQSVISRATNIIREEEIQAFIIKSFRFLSRNLFELVRPALPKAGHQVKNDVQMPTQMRMGDAKLGYLSSKPEIEEGVVSAHEKFTEQGDTVVIVGGGDGVTAVRAGKIVGESGKIYIYEGGKGAISKIDSVLNLNGTREITSIHHSVVGEEINVYGGSTKSADITSASELPNCDVLELDCEGAEVEVLKALKYVQE